MGQVICRSKDDGNASQCRALLSLLVLFIVYVINQADRQLLPVAIPAGLRCSGPAHNGTDTCSAAELPHSASNYSSPGVTAADDTSELSAPCSPHDCIAFTDMQQGLLVGLAFTTVYTVVGIPLSRVADITSRTKVLMSGLFVWTSMLLWTGLSTRYWMLLVSRMGLAVGEATCNPSAYALISDYFVSGDRAKALSFYHFAVYLGGSMGYILGSVIISICWRWSFYILAISGYVVFFLVLLVLREPKRGELSFYNPKQHLPIKEMLVRLFSSKAYLMLCISASVRNIAGYALGAWLPTFYSRQHQIPVDKYAPVLGFIVLFGGGTGSLLGGYLADRFSVKRKQAKAYVICVSQLLAIPFICGTLFAKNLATSYTMLLFSYLAAETWLGCAAAIVQDLFVPNMRAQASAVYIAVNTLIGGGLGPLLVPIILKLMPGWNECTDGVGLSLAVIVPTSYAVSALSFGIVGHLLKNHNVDHFLKYLNLEESGEGDEIDLFVSVTKEKQTWL